MFTGGYRIHRIGMIVVLGLAIVVLPGDALATRLVDVLPVDRQCLVVHFQDGTVHYQDMAEGSDVYYTSGVHDDAYIPYGEPLDTAVAKRPDTFSLRSSEGREYGENGKHPVTVHRKSKVWEASYTADMPAMHHWIYLELPFPLVRGKTYVLDIDGGTNTDRTRAIFLSDECALESPSIRISHLGYEAGAVHKTADVHLWMGDGGGRDFSPLEGTPFHLYDANIRRKVSSRSSRRIRSGTGTSGNSNTHPLPISCHRRKLAIRRCRPE